MRKIIGILLIALIPTIVLAQDTMALIVFPELFILSHPFITFFILLILAFFTIGMFGTLFISVTNKFSKRNLLGVWIIALLLATIIILILSTPILKNAGMILVG